MNFYHKPLNDFTNDELQDIMDHVEKIGLMYTGGIALEILRRMNEKKPLLENEDNDWGNPLTP